MLWYARIKIVFEHLVEIKLHSCKWCLNSDINPVASEKPLDSIMGIDVLQRCVYGFPLEVYACLL